jgi:hypothetical protein
MRSTAAPLRRPMTPRANWAYHPIMRLSAGLLLFFLAGACLCACQVGTSGLATVGRSPDGGAEATAGPDTNPVDGAPNAPTVGCSAQTCAGACCGDQCVSRSCAGCAVGGIFCPYVAGGDGGTCVADCSACAVSGIPATTTCFTCADAGLSAQCAPSATACPADLEAGACPCASGTAEQCPGPAQTCARVDGQYTCLSP